MTFLYELFGGILHWLYTSLGSNYGLAIVAFAIFAKLITLPLTIKQTKSTQMMKIIQPQVKALQQKYAKNQQQLNEELQKLYKRYNYSPLSGCLPLLIQFPIIIGLFGVLREPTKYVFTTAEFANVSQQFLFLSDLQKSSVQMFQEYGFSLVAILSAILPLISVGLTFIQQRQTMAGQENQQKGMMMFMNIFMVYISFTFAQGIALYWTLQTGLGILQNFLIMKFIPVKVPEVEPVIKLRENQGHKPAPAKKDNKTVSNQKPIPKVNHNQIEKQNREKAKQKTEAKLSNKNSVNKTKFVTDPTKVITNKKAPSDKKNN